MHPSYEWSLSTIITTLLMKVNYLCTSYCLHLESPFLLESCDLRHWKISVLTRYKNYSGILVLGFQTYSFGKMNAQKWKLNFMIIQTNLAIDLAISFGIMNQVHYIDNRFNLNSTNFTCYEQFHVMFGIHIHNVTKSISWSV